MIISAGFVIFMVGWILIKFFGYRSRLDPLEQAVYDMLPIGHREANWPDNVGAMLALAGAVLMLVSLVVLSVRYLP